MRTFITNIIKSIAQTWSPEEPLARLTLLLEYKPDVPPYKQWLHRMLGGRVGGTLGALYVLMSALMLILGQTVGSTTGMTVAFGVCVLTYIFLAKKFTLFNNATYPPTPHDLMLLEQEIGVFCHRNPEFVWEFDRPLGDVRQGALSAWWAGQMHHTLGRLVRFSRLSPAREDEVIIEPSPYIREHEEVPLEDTLNLRRANKKWNI